MIKWFILLLAFPDWLSHTIAIFNRFFSNVPLSVSDEFNGLTTWCAILAFAIIWEIEKHTK